MQVIQVIQFAELHAHLELGLWGGVLWWHSACVWGEVLLLLGGLLLVMPYVELPCPICIP